MRAVREPGLRRDDKATHALDEDLADPDAPADLPEPGLHRLARAEDGHAADLALKPDAVVRRTLLAPFPISSPSSHTAGGHGRTRDAPWAL